MTIDLSVNGNLLIVEGEDDKYSVVSLMKAQGIDWNASTNRPVEIEVGNGASKILADKYITTTLKTPNLRNLGLILDADESAAGRDQSVFQKFQPKAQLYTWLAWQDPPSASREEQLPRTTWIQSLPIRQIS